MKVYNYPHKRSFVILVRLRIVKDLVNKYNIKILIRIVRHPQLVLLYWTKQWTLCAKIYGMFSLITQADVPIRPQDVCQVRRRSAHGVMIHKDASSKLVQQERGSDALTPRTPRTPRACTGTHTSMVGI